MTRVYPSLRYTLDTEPSPALIGADALRGGDRRDGAGHQDRRRRRRDRPDATRSSARPASRTRPASRRASTTLTTPKVIVARSVPRPGLRRGGRAARSTAHASFHGTHVSGIAAGDAGTTAPAGRDHPAVSGPLRRRAARVARQLPRLHRADAVGHVANTPEIVAAFEAAVSDGMDVINFSGGGPQTDPANDAMIETIRERRRGRRRPGDRGRQRPRRLRRSASVGSPGTAPDAISVAAVSNTRSSRRRSRSPTRARRRASQRVPFRASTGGAPASVGHGRPDARRRRLRSSAPTGKPVERAPLRAGRRSERRRDTTLPAGSLTGAIALVSRGACAFVSKAQRARAAGAVGIVLVDNRLRRGEPRSRSQLCRAARDDRRPRRRAAARLPRHADGGRAHDPRRPATRRRSRPAAAASITSFSSAGPTAFGHLLKPDVSAPGGADPLLDAARVRRLAVRRLRRHEHGDAARRGRGRAAAPAAPRLDAGAGQVGARCRRRARLGGHGAHERGAGARSRAAGSSTSRGRRPAGSSPTRRRSRSAT